VKILLRKYLPEATIICIDHHIVQKKNSSTQANMYEKRVVVENQKLRDLPPIVRDETNQPVKRLSMSL
jgi:hypothetical protein